MTTSPHENVSNSLHRESRFVPDRLSSGYHGVYDTSLNIYVLRDTSDVFAELVARRLNAPMSWEPSAPQYAADAVRQVLLAERILCDADLVH
jgi:hypothetical protein